MNVNWSLSDLTDAIPSVCASLKMKVEPMIDLADISQAEPSIACYSIELF